MHFWKDLFSKKHRNAFQDQRKVWQPRSLLTTHNANIQYFQNSGHQAKPKICRFLTPMLYCLLIQHWRNRHSVYLAQQINIPPLINHHCPILRPWCAYVNLRLQSLAKIQIVSTMTAVSVWRLPQTQYKNAFKLGNLSYTRSMSTFWLKAEILQLLVYM